MGPKIPGNRPVLATPLERGHPLLAFPDEYDAIESLHAKLQRAVCARDHFPTDESALKLLFLVLNLAQKEWRMPPREWAMAKVQFAIIFEGRFKLA
jgi:putative transposase